MKILKKLTSVTKLLLISLLLISQLILADEINKMNTIDGKSKDIKVKNFFFERTDSSDSTRISIITSRSANVKCAIFDKNDKPITVSKNTITAPISEVIVLSKNAMITSVNCWEDESVQSIKSLEDEVDVYYKMPTFLLDD